MSDFYAAEEKWIATVMRRHGLRFAETLNRIVIQHEVPGLDLGRILHFTMDGERLSTLRIERKGCVVDGSLRFAEDDYVMGFVVSEELPEAQTLDKQSA